MQKAPNVRSKLRRWLIVILQAIGLAAFGFAMVLFSEAYPQYVPGWVLASRWLFVLALIALLVFAPKSEAYGDLDCAIIGMGAVVLGLFNGAILDKATVVELITLRAPLRESVLIALGFALLVYALLRVVWFSLVGNRRP